MERKNATLTPLADGPGWLVLNKPAGLETVVKGGGNTRDCFTSLARRRLGIHPLLPCHRLDRDTTGCLLFATDENTRQQIEEAFREHTVTKTYLAVTLGVPKLRKGTIAAGLSAWSGGRRPVKVARGRKALPAETAYTVLAQGEASSDLPRGIALVQFSPRTGRTHQIRVHAAHLGTPVLGDDQYGDRNANRTVQRETGLAHQALHAWKLSIPQQKEIGRIRATAFLPEAVTEVLERYVEGWKNAVKKG